VGAPQQRTQYRQVGRERLRSAPERPSRERLRAVREPRRREPASPRARALAVAALALGAVVVVLLVVLLAGSGSPSAPKLTPAAIAGSLMDKIGSTGPEDGARCTAQGTKRWACDVPDTSGSGGASYAVTGTSSRCWKAELVRLYGEQAPQAVRGCL
jgi:hypothetical protein